MGRLIAAADAILASDGYDALTVRAIAEKAGVPVGTFYQFFPDKQAIIDVIARRYMDQFALVMEELVVQALEVPWFDLIDTVLDAFIEMYRANPGYLAIWLGRHLSPELLEADEHNNELLAEGLRQILVVQAGIDDSDELARIARVAVFVGDALLQLAFRTTPGGDAGIIAEAKRIARLYLDDIVARPQAPPPRAAANRRQARRA